MTNFEKINMDYNIINTVYTDVNTDYNSISKEPVYFEFVNIGEALTKLQYYEHALYEHFSEKIQNEKYLVPTKDRILPIYVTKREFRGSSLVKIEFIDCVGDTIIKEAPFTNMFNSFQEALAYLKNLNKED